LSIKITIKKLPIYDLGAQIDKLLPKKEVGVINHCMIFFYANTITLKYI